MRQRGLVPMRAEALDRVRAALGVRVEYTVELSLREVLPQAYTGHCGRQDDLCGVERARHTRHNAGFRGLHCPHPESWAPPALVRLAGGADEALGLLLLDDRHVLLRMAHRNEHLRDSLCALLDLMHGDTVGALEAVLDLAYAAHCAARGDVAMWPRRSVHAHRAHLPFTDPSYSPPPGTTPRR